MIVPTLFRTKFKIRILYKSGNSHEFWCTTFKRENTGSGVTYSWQTVTQTNAPILIGVDEIEAVYQVGGRLNIFTLIWQVITPPYF